MQSRTTRIVLVGAILALLVGLLPAAALADTTTVSVNPPSQSVVLNQNVVVEVKVTGVTNLYGVDVRLSFDKTKLQVQDADGNSANGVQIASGDFMNPAQGFLAQNTADNVGGTIQYVFALMAPANPVSGNGVVARITFKGIAQGNAAVNLTSATLSNEQAQPIAVTMANGAVTVVPVAGPTPVPTVPGPTPVPPPPGGVTLYTVQWGDSLYAIAGRFGVTIDAIVAANGLANANWIWAGQVLIIPVGTPPGPGPVPGPTTHVVQPGENLYRIALRYGVSIDAIVAANGIINPWYIRVGQVLTIPGGVTPIPGPVGTYVVQPGDTIYGIAARLGKSPWAIIAANNLPNPNLIYVGQVLQIP